jgi:peptide/nickel transport system permease protein
MSAEPTAPDSAPTAIPLPRPAPRGATRTRLVRFAQTLRQAPKLPTAIVGLAVFVAVFADALVPHNPETINPIDGEKPPAFIGGGTWTYPLGTDRKGRDILSRVILGTRVSLAVAVGAIVIGGLVGTGLGFVAGFRGGWVDALIMRAADAFLAFPSILIALVLAVTVGPSFTVVVTVLGLILWARFARLIRGEVLYWKTRDFIGLARVAGARGTYIVRRHLFPNVLNAIVVLCTLQIGWAIIVEASLSFLGAGVPPPTPTWGGMVAEGLSFIERAWWISVCPGAAMMLVVLCFNLVGDWVRDALDPRLRQL